MSWDWGQFFFLLMSVLLVWLLYRRIKAQPEQFSKENIGKSLNTLGILALGLILFIWILVLMLRSG